MEPNDILDLVAGLADRVSGAIQTGSAWEIWLQVELASALMRAYGVQGREIWYPDGSKRVDLAFTRNDRYYFIEIKVESATNAQQFAGQSLTAAVGADIEKLKGMNYGTDPARWVLVVAYSTPARNDLQELCSDMPTGWYRNAPPIGAAILDADRY